MEHFESYRKTMTDKIVNARPEDLMVMLYDAMITRMKQAQDRFQAGQTVRAKESTVRAMKIADALMENLNLEEGGETAQNLEKLYYFIINELSIACRGEDPVAHLDNALKVMQTLHEGWRGLAEKST